MAAPLSRAEPLDRGFDPLEPVIYVEGLGFPEGPVVLPDRAIAFVDLLDQKIRLYRDGAVPEVCTPKRSPNGMRLVRTAVSMSPITAASRREGAAAPRSSSGRSRVACSGSRRKARSATLLSICLAKRLAGRTISLHRAWRHRLHGSAELGGYRKSARRLIPYAISWRPVAVGARRRPRDAPCADDRLCKRPRLSSPRIADCGAHC